MSEAHCFGDYFETESSGPPKATFLQGARLLAEVEAKYTCSRVPFKRAQLEFIL